jgi:hypothetical protein
LKDGVTKWIAAATSGETSRAMPAGFDHTVLASSAAAAPPANAFPTPLPEFSCSANAAPSACPAERVKTAPATAAATRVCLSNLAGILLTSQSARNDALKCRPRRLAPAPDG